MISAVCPLCLKSPQPHMHGNVVCVVNGEFWRSGSLVLYAVLALTLWHWSLDKSLTLLVPCFTHLCNVHFEAPSPSPFWWSYGGLSMRSGFMQGWGRLELGGHRDRSMNITFPFLTSSRAYPEKISLFRIVIPFSRYWLGGQDSPIKWIPTAGSSTGVLILQLHLK